MKASELKSEIDFTLGQPLLNIETVIDACDRLSVKIAGGDYKEMMDEAGIPGALSPELIKKASRMLSRESLTRKITTELGTEFGRRDRFPLGVLLHIGAGNMDGISAYSVIEGLLTGNINLLKLPEDEQGISAILLRELIRLEPSLNPYIYTFSCPSSNQRRLRQLMDLSDAVVLWGGDEAVTSVRALASPNTRLIEWGHKLSFAYVTMDGMERDTLYGLARHMIETRQVLCSSCQGIYVDTGRPDVTHRFARTFLALLKQAAEEAAIKTGGPDLGMTAQNTLRRQEARLFAMLSPDGARMYEDGGVSVSVSSDSSLTPSLMYGNCWVKPLPRAEIISTLHGQKGYLQTVGLLCGSPERGELSYLLCRAGAVRVCQGSDMSLPPENGAHDGEYPLRRYQRIISR